MTHRTLVTLLAGLGVAGACGGEQPTVNPPVTPMVAPSAPPAATVAAAPDTPPGPGDWVTWSHERKLGYMKSAVMPKMGGAFHDFDGAKYATPKCNLCHAAGAKDASFKMPDAAIPKLPANPDEMKALAAKEPKMFEFMAKTVVPQTAALLGQQAYDMNTKVGFGCFGCHTKS